MNNLIRVGRIFYGIAIGGMGFQTFFDHDFPYMLIPPGHDWIPGLTAVCYIFGAMLMIAGVCIVLGKKTGEASLLLGTVFLLIFCFYFVPYQLVHISGYTHFGDWENSIKELTLSGGAYVIAGCFQEKNESTFEYALERLIPLGRIFFSLAMISYGISHLLYGRQVVDYVPSWIPNRLFWAYFPGIPLIGSGIAILFKVRVPLIAALLGSMILVWVLILHIPYVINATAAGFVGELTSAFLALAYSGTAFVIAGAANKNNSRA